MTVVVSGAYIGQNVVEYLPHTGGGVIESLAIGARATDLSPEAAAFVISMAENAASRPRRVVGRLESGTDPRYLR